MKKGDFIRVDYIGRLESGEIFDLTLEDVAKKENVHDPKIKYKPVPIIVGAGFIIPGVDTALENLNVGDKKEISVGPEEGFGKRNPEMIKVLQKKVFEGKVEPVQGLIVDFSGMKGRIQSVSGGRITVDFNNPLAGKNLTYDIEVKEKIEDINEQAKSIFEFFGVEKIDIKINENVIDIETSRLPDQLKDKASKLILDYVKPNGKNLEKIRYIDVVEKTNENKDATPIEQPKQ